jgi:hypothetical protein
LFSSFFLSFNLFFSLQLLNKKLLVHHHLHHLLHILRRIMVILHQIISQNFQNKPILMVLLLLHHHHLVVSFQLITMVQCVEHPLTLLITQLIPHLNMIIISKHVFALLHLNIFQILTDGNHHHHI